MEKTLQIRLGVSIIEVTGMRVGRRTGPGHDSSSEKTMDIISKIVRFNSKNKQYDTGSSDTHSIPSLVRIKSRRLYYGLPSIIHESLPKNFYLFIYLCEKVEVRITIEKETHRSTI